MNKIGGSTRVQDELSAALAEGRGVTAKVRWISKADEDGRNRWIHCTPLLGSNGHVGVWMVVLVDDDQDLIVRKWKQAPPVGPHRGKIYCLSRSTEQGADQSDRTNAIDERFKPRNHNSQGKESTNGSLRSFTPESVRI